MLNAKIPRSTSLTNQCQGRNARGGTCGAPPTNGSQYCFWHDPTRRDEQRLAATKGGLTSRPRPLPLDTPDPRLRCPGDVVALVEQIAGAVSRGELSPNLANSSLYGASIALRAMEVEVEARLDQLEHVIEVRKAGGLS